MVKCMCLTLIVLCLFCSSGRADLVITEVMANEPGEQSSLQWFEIYNDGSETRNLAFYQFYIDGQYLSDFVISEAIAGYDYRVIVKRVTSGAGETGFEAVWGNNNGSWILGEPGEDYHIHEYSNLNLNDSGGTVALYRLGNLISSFTWTEAGFDGVSWERYSTATALIANATNPEGGTPGHKNSISLRMFDLAMEQVKIWPAAFGLTNLEIRLINRGMQPYDAGTITFSYDPDGDGVVFPEDLIGQIPFPALAVDETIYILTAVELDGVYNHVKLQLPDDDWPSNNAHNGVAPGNAYPPLILYEIMADPKAPLATEWVEIYNRSDLTLDLNGWLLGNADILYPIASTSLLMEAGQLMVLCKDSLAFVDFYGAGDYAIREPGSWPTLRNTGDKIMLNDNYGFEADTFSYAKVFGDNYTWGRYNQSVSNVVWGQSREAGGTPGQENNIYLPPSSPDIEITIEPNPFSYSRDEAVHITVAVPEGESMSVRVYDRDGRVVRTLIDNAQPYDESLNWNGYSDGGRALPPGIYILYVEVSGKGSVKKTIVLSP